MQTLFKLILLIAITFSSSVSLAKTSEWAISDAVMDYGLSQFGASYKVQGYTLNILIDQDEVLNHLDEQIRNGNYNQSYSKGYLMSHPLSYLTVSASNSIIYIIPRVYHDHPNLNYISVNVHIKYTNILGNDMISSLLSFNMSRELNNQINWDRFSPANSSDVYPNFRFSDFIWDRSHIPHH